MHIKQKTAELPFRDTRGNVVGHLKIFAPRTPTDALIEVSRDECEQFSEEPFQLLESARYEYSVHPPGLTLRESFGRGVVRPSVNPQLAHTGILEPGVRTGRLALELLDNFGDIVGQAAFEVRSKKLDYRSDLRQMLADITARAVDLAFDVAAPTTLKAKPDPSTQPTTLHQQFCFLKGLLEGGALDAALHLVVTRPYERLERDQEIQLLGRGIRMSGKAATEMARSGRRQAIQSEHPLYSRIRSLPLAIPVPGSRRTTNTPENRFIKFVLEQFAGFVHNVGLAAKTTKSRRLDRLKIEVDEIEKWLQGYLLHPAFSGLTALDRIPLESPVLQRQAGYREVMTAWLRFDMAARLVWEGSDDVYAAGQQNVATLYEYWVFFELLQIITTKCSFKERPAAKLLQVTGDRLSLRLRTGHNIAISGKATINEVELCIQLDYNRTFIHKKAVGEIGTWTQWMKPDYTMTVWPAHLSEEDAALSGALFHVHFDAKYRVDALERLFGVEDSSTVDTDVLAQEAESLQTDEIETYKREDLLKMHAYKDAIRRSVGAYVIYPGKESVQWTGYHELLPGLGAFVLRPGSGASELSTFIDNVLQHASTQSVQGDVAEKVAKSYESSNGTVTKKQL